jgi:UDP-N-acetylmuramoyl-L-alanyl-D-glutamate--2,6-diaminopimelate ligase
MARELKYIIAEMPCKITGDPEVSVNHVTFDSRKIEKGDLFVAVKGTQVDGHDFIDSAISKGAIAIVCEHNKANQAEETVIIEVEDSALALGILAANFYNNPSKELILTGVTGTNGKTSIVTLLYKLFTEFGIRSGLISTVRNLIGSKEKQATHTTPDAIALQALMREMKDEGCTHVFMEVSSHAIDQKRITGLDFDLAVFTNLTHDHLDYHKNFDHYIKTKKKLFDNLSENAIALVNSDDKHGQVMVQNTAATIKTFGLRSVADFKAKIIESHFDGMLINIDNTEVWTKIIGEFNASNLLSVYAAANLLGYGKDDILRVISTLNTVEGRFEHIRSNTGVTAIIDYAHTPDALKNVLATINQIRTENGKLITVVGAGGNRDKTKRPVMGRIATANSNTVIFTSDNPRDEEPQDIIDQLLSGVEINRRNNVLAIVDRREAIRTACIMAKEGDVVLIAGKGHETYQEIKGERFYFSDKQVVSELFMVNKINLQ